MESQIPLIKKEQKELKQREKQQEQETRIRKRRFKKIMSWGLGSSLFIALIGGIVWYIATRPPILESDIISRNAIHWHPELTIYVKDKKQEIPMNIGIGAIHQPVHTHDDNDQGIIHLEFQGLVKKQNITLGQFFKNWGKDIRSFGANMKMIVNGKENTEYENYIMRDNDKIELRYE
ncbi:MAG: hypothetical protein AAB396_02905 [Patescibacteria group bacterium]